jgi:hypothetical protein
MADSNLARGFEVSGSDHFGGGKILVREDVIACGAFQIVFLFGEYLRGR